MKKSITIILFLFLIACNKQDDLLKTDINNQELTCIDKPMSPEEINSFIKSEIKNSGNFDWNTASDYLIWSAAAHGNNIITIGYGKSSFSDFKNTDDKNIKNQLIEEINTLEKSTEKNLIYEDEILNYFDIYIKDIKTITKIRKDKKLRYIQPSGYNFLSYEQRDKSDSGCSTEASNINANDYRIETPGCMVPWTFDKHNIPQAWTYSTGQGITVGLIDTGVSDYQSLLGSSFSDGISVTSRYISKYGTFVDSWMPWATKTDGYHDKCGHGTSMAATIASPRNNDNMPVGVAYNCNLISYRGTSDVVLDGYHEQNGVAKALTNLANTSSVRIISMSIGHIFSIGKIEDAIKYAYSKNKLIIAAGGTSTWFTNWAGVIFPANMNETVAVTGITDDTQYEECETCHKGSKIDFTITMERYYDVSRHSVCLGYYNNQKSYIGGSSVATSMTAGIAALVWSRHPEWTRSQVLNKLIQSSQFYPNKNSDFGYGNINALAAVQ